MRSDPTHSPQGESPRGAPKPDLWALVPRRKQLTWFSSLHCPSPGQPTAPLDPRHSQELTLEGEREMLPVAIYTLFLSPATYFFHSL